MSATIRINCDYCGAPRPMERPDTWWSLEQQGKKQTTTPRDFCTLAHLLAWLNDQTVQDAFPLDFVTPGGSDGGV